MKKKKLGKLLRIEKDPFNLYPGKKKKIGGFTQVTGNTYQNKMGQYFKKKGKKFIRIPDI
jgi:hypothetical protein